MQSSFAFTESEMRGICPVRPDSPEQTADQASGDFADVFIPRAAAEFIARHGPGIEDIHSDVADLNRIVSAALDDIVRFRCSALRDGIKTDRRDDRLPPLLGGYAGFHGDEDTWISVVMDKALLFHFAADEDQQLLRQGLFALRRKKGKSFMGRGIEVRRCMTFDLHGNMRRRAARHPAQTGQTQQGET